MSLSHDYLADYRTLGCRPGCSLSELEQAWRSAMRVAHPDRAPDGERAAAAVRAQELNMAFRRLRDFSRRHGRLPGNTPESAARQGDASAASAARPGFGQVDAAIASGVTSGRRIGLRGLAVLAILAAAGVAIALQPTVTRPTGLAANDARPIEPITADPAALFGLGSHRDEVRDLAGEPVSRSGDPPNSETWEYGPSHVSFRAHRVIGWYSSPMYPLPVASEAPEPALIAPPSRR